MIIEGNGLIAQSGGPTAVINNSVCGVLEEWFAKNSPGKLYGAIYGMKGILEENFIDLQMHQDRLCKELRYTPGAALGSSRYKLKTERDYAELLSILKKYNIRFFFYIGGNDSMDTASKIHKLALRENYDMQVMGIPKTVDNDLMHTDHCPGYGSAAKYLATTVMETGLDLRGIISSNRIVILEAMGRHTGWLAAAAALAKREKADAPHLIYLPEVPFEKEKFLADVNKVYQDIGYAYIVVSEGLVDKNGKYIFASDRADSFGHSQLGGLADLLKGWVEEETGVKVRCNILGSTQRSAMHFASQTDAKEAYLVGAEAVRLAVKGDSGVMVTLEREAGKPYFCKPGHISLDKVANREKKFP